MLTMTEVGKGGGDAIIIIKGRSSPKNIKRVLKNSVIIGLLRRTYVKIDKLAGSGYSLFAREIFSNGKRIRLSSISDSRFDSRRKFHIPSYTLNNHGLGFSGCSDSEIDPAGRSPYSTGKRKNLVTLTPECTIHPNL